MKKVKPFAELMESRLEENAHKGNWENCDMDFLIERLIKNTSDAVTAVLRNDHEAAKKSAADVAVYAMKILETGGDL